MKKTPTHLSHRLRMWLRTEHLPSIHERLWVPSLTMEEKKKQRERKTDFSLTDEPGSQERQIKQLLSTPSFAHSCKYMSL